MMGRWVFPVCKWKFYPQMCIPRCFSALWCWISDTARQICFGCQETILSLKITFSLPCGRQHSPQRSAAVGALVLPLLTLICPCGSCPFSLASPALWTFFLPILLSPSLFTNKDVLQHPWRIGKKRTHPLILEELPCNASPAVLSQFSKSFSLCHLSLSTCQRTILKYFWFYINLLVRFI